MGRVVVEHIPNATWDAETLRATMPYFATTIELDNLIPIIERLEELLGNSWLDPTMFSDENTSALDCILRHTIDMHIGDLKQIISKQAEQIETLKKEGDRWA